MPPPPLVFVVLTVVLKSLHTPDNFALDAIVKFSVLEKTMNQNFQSMMLNQALELKLSL